MVLVAVCTNEDSAPLRETFGIEMLFSGLFLNISTGFDRWNVEIIEVDGLTSVRKNPHNSRLRQPSHKGRGEEGGEGRGVREGEEG